MRGGARVGLNNNGRVVEFNAEGVGGGFAEDRMSGKLDDRL